MKSQSIAFLLGILLLQKFHSLPSLYWVILSLFCLLGWQYYFKQKLFLLITLVVGFSWSLISAHHRLDWNVPERLEGKAISASGYIASLPTEENHQLSFLFYIEKFNNQVVNHLVKLTWIHYSNHLSVGDQWNLLLRLKRIHGNFNPGGFDYEGWAFASDIRGVGYVVKSDSNQIVSSHWYSYPLSRLRQYLQYKIENNLAHTRTSPWIEALIIGERHHIAPEYWDILRNTGTNHLMAIAGLHIGIMAALMHALVSFLWRRKPQLVVLLPVQQAGAIAALITGLTYSALAGFSIPTQRACIMLAVFLITFLLRRKIIAWHAWAIALWVMLLINPFDVMTESFWLSFGSVALIIYGMSARLKPVGLWWKWGRVQGVIAVGLIPFSIWLFHQFSLIGFVANSIAIPWVAFLIVPLCLFGTLCLVFSVKMGGFFLLLADRLLAILWRILDYLSHLSWASYSLLMPNNYILIATCIGFLLLLLPSGFPGKYLGMIWLLPLLFYKTPTPNSGEVWLTLLDVGQGLATVVQTQKHILIFDTGPSLGAHNNMGESVILPFLATLNLKVIDTLVISHGDNDHIGGASSIIKNYPIQFIKTSVPDKVAHAQYCLQGDAWEWDHVQFKFLYPAMETLGSNNNSSCVLSVTTGTQHILLTGDIEKDAEDSLTNHPSNQLFSQILIAPHHGSKTSIQDDFIQSVHPSYVLYAIGYKNRYHFPHQSTIDKYQAMGATQLNTVNSGAILMKINPYIIDNVELYRDKKGKYWNDHVD